MPHGGESFISSSEAKVLGSLKPATMTDGDEDSSLEVPEERSIEHLPVHEKEIIFPVAEPLAPDNEGYTAAISVVLCNCACARLALESRCAVGRCYTCRSEKPEHERKARENAYNCHLQTWGHRDFSHFLI